MSRPVCEHCEEPLRAGARSVARFCSTRCRVAAHRARRALPAEMRSKRRWVRRAADKRPVTVSGAAASSTNPRTWSDLPEARASQAGVGLGFVLAADGIACIDLDHCLSGGRVAAWAQRILDMTRGTYVEVSPSGDGLHVWGLATVGKGRRVRVEGGAVEVYDRGRYITVTGERFEGSPARLIDISEAVASLT